MTRLAPVSLLFCIAHLVLSIALGTAAQCPTRPRVPGIAFRLTPDYGLASIYLKDGTHVPVAQIYGSPLYNALMRKNAATETLSIKDHGTFCSLLAPAINKTPFTLRYALDICQTPDILVLRTMLGALTAEVEAYLGTNICFVAIVLDYTHGHVVQSTQEALRVLGLRQVLGTTWASRSVVRSQPPSVYNGTDMEPHSVLAIDYSFHWFNIGLYRIDEVGLVDPVPGFVDRLKIGEQSQLEAFKQSLKEFAENIPIDVKSPDRLNLYGDDAENQSVLEIIETMFNSKLIREARISKSAYSGVANVAKAAHEEMDTADFEMTAPASLGCRWRSKLYGRERTEL